MHKYIHYGHICTDLLGNANWDDMWYLDDATFAGPPETVLEDLKKVIDLSKKAGLQLNPQKCEYKILGPDNATLKENIKSELEKITPGIREILNDNAVLLGCPLTDETIEPFLQRKFDQLDLFASRLRNISSHCAYYLLKHSLTIPRLNYFLRCCPVWKKVDLLRIYDQKITLILEETLNCNLSREACLQSSLPVKMGGLGIRNAAKLAIPSFLASFYSILELHKSLLADLKEVNTSILTEASQIWLTETESPYPEDHCKQFQKHWELPYYARTINELEHLINNNSIATARWLASKTPQSSAWLNALPSPQLGTFLNNETFRIACALRLGVKICHSHKCICGETVDEYGLHGLSCRRQKGRVSRHAAGNDIIARALRTADIPSLLEPTGISRTDGKHPDGMTLIPWKNGKCLLWDFTCVDTYCHSYINQTSIRSGAAAGQAEVKKQRKYSTLQSNFLFVPVAVETSGCWGSEAMKFIRSIGMKITQSTDEPRAISFLFQQLSIAIQRGNAASVLGTFPSSKCLAEIFYLS